MNVSEQDLGEYDPNVSRFFRLKALRESLEAAERGFERAKTDCYYASRYALEHRRSPDALAGLQAAVAHCEEAERRLVDADAALREASEAMAP